MNKKPMKKEYAVNKGKVNKRPLVDPKKSRVLTSIRLEGVVFQWFMAESERTGVPYQTLINSYLKQAIEGPSVKELEGRIQRLEKALLKEGA